MSLDYSCTTAYLDISRGDRFWQYVNRIKNTKLWWKSQGSLRISLQDKQVVKKSNERLLFFCPYA